MNTQLLTQSPSALAPNALDFTAQLGNRQNADFRDSLANSLGEHSSLKDYNDINALQSLKYKTGEDRDAALDATAKHFESLFVSMMIKSMRDANKVFSEGNMLQSSQGDFYQQMFDSQLAVSLSTGKGIGLADVIKRQLAARENLNMPSVAGEGFALNSKQKFFSLDEYARLPEVNQTQVDQLQHVMKDIEQRIDSAGGVAGLEGVASASLAQSENRAHDFSSPDKFIESLYPYAKQVELETGIDARLMLAQSALETGWGKHQIHHQDGSPSHNMFGIKSHRDWDGNEVNVMTTEYRNGVAMKESANFRAYDSYADSFRDYARFLQSNSRYDAALASADDPKVFAEKLQSAGYATDPNYADKIHSILDRYMNLDRFSVDESEGDEFNKDHYQDSLKPLNDQQDSIQASLTSKVGV